MKDLAHHMKHVQRKVVQSIRKNETKEKRNKKGQEQIPPPKFWRTPPNKALSS